MNREDKLGITKNVAEQYKIDLPEDVTQFILESADTEEELKNLVLKTAIHASYDGLPISVKIVEEVLEESVDDIPLKPKIPGKVSDLFEAIEAGDLESMRKFIRQGCDLEEISDERWGLTPLLVAAELQNAEAMKVLLDAGADPDYDGHSSCHPIHPATVEVECLKVILEAGASPNAYAEDYITPLMTVMRDEALPQALMLLEAGADPARVDRDGLTALDRAVKNGARKVAKELRRRLEIQLHPGELT